MGRKFVDNDAGTVISSFSDPWDPDNANSDTNMRESYTLKDVIQEALGGKNSTFIDSAEGLVHLILRNGLDFFELEGPLGMKFQDCFQASINDVVIRPIAPNWNPTLNI